MSDLTIKRTKLRSGPMKGSLRHSTKINGQEFTRTGSDPDTLDALLLAAYARVTLELDPPRPVGSLESVLTFLHESGYTVTPTDKGYDVVRADQ